MMRMTFALFMYVKYPASPLLEGFTVDNKAGLLTYVYDVLSLPIFQTVASLDI
ncbi:hypothetical protein SAMN05880580_1209 [Priestia flexa]|nr:hypothetical protein SAMN05880580_1209 [Priestia flexa]